MLSTIHKHIFILITFAVAHIGVGSAFAQVTESPQTVTVDGRLYEAGSTTEGLLDASVVMRVQILNPAKSCILYEEQHTFSTLATNGHFNIQVGSNVGDLAKRSALDSANSMATVFFNRSTPITGKTSGGGGCAYTPASADVRHFRFFVTPSTVGSTSQLSPDMRIDSVPQALVAQTLQGLGKDDVFKTSVTSTQAKLDNLLTTNYTNITDLIGGTSSMYLRNASTGTLLPTRATDPSTPAAGQLWYDTTANEIKYYNGTAIQSVGAAGAGISSLTAGSGLSGGTITTSGTIAIATGGVTNAMLATGIDASKITAGTLPVGVVPTNTDTTKLPLAGGTMTGAITMGAATTFGGFDLLGTGHITMNGQKTITVGRYDSTQETTLISTLNGANAGATWYNNTTNKLMYWNGAAARELAETTTAGGDITAVNTNAGSGLTGGGTSGPITLAINVDNSTIEVATNTVQVKDAGITNAKLANDAVTSAKILDGEVTNAKIATMNITKLTNGAGDYFAYMPAGTECATGEVLKWNAATDRWLCNTDATGATDHGALTGLSDDDHTQYVMLAGRSGGQTVRGGTASGDDITIESTSDATKGDVILQPSGGNVGIGTAIPSDRLHVAGNLTATGRMAIGGNSQYDHVLRGDNGTANTKITALQFVRANYDPTGVAAELSMWRGGGAAEGNLRFATNPGGSTGQMPTERMVISSNGNVGIGSTTPSARLNVVASGTTDGLNVQSAGGNLIYDQYGNFQTPYGLRAGGFAFFQRMADADNGFNRLLVGSNVNYEPSANVYDVTPNAAFDRAAIEFLNGGTISFITDAVDRTASSTLTPAQWNALTKMVIRPTGNVGIGTTTPASRLDIEGTIQIGDGGETCSVAANAGMIKYAASTLQYCNGSSWQTLGVSGAGLTTLNGQTGSTQTFAVNATGTAPAINSATNTHTLSIPLASGAGVTSGTISKTDYDSFVAKLSAVTGSTLNSARLWVGDSGNQAAAVLMSGDATLSNTGALTIAADAITTGKIADGTITNADISGTAAIAWSKIDKTGAVAGDVGAAPSTRSIATAAGSGLSGGGDLSADRSLSLNINGTTAETVPASGDEIIMYDTSATALRKITRANFLTGYLQSSIGTSAGTVMGADAVPNCTAAQKLQMSLGPTYTWSCVSEAVDAVVADADNDTKIQVEEAADEDKIRFDTAGSERMIIDNAGNVGIGTTNPASKLDIQDTNSSVGINIQNNDSSSPTYPGVWITNYRGAANAGAFPEFSLSNARGTRASPLATASGTIIGQMNWWGYGTTGWTKGAEIRAVAQENFTDTSSATRLEFQTTPSGSGGAAASVIRMTILSDGNVGIGTTAPAVSLDLNTKTDAIRLPAGTTAQQPTAANGMIRYNTTNNKFEGYENGAWVNLRDPSSGSTVSAGAGTVGAPSLSFSGDPNTGFYSNGADVIGVSAGGANIFDLSSAGLVSPTTGGGRVTTANGTASAPTFSFAGDTGTGIFRQAANTLGFATGGTERMRVTASGNLYMYGTDASNSIMIENLSSTTARYPNFGTYNHTGAGLGGYGMFANHTARGSNGARAAVQAGDVIGSFQSSGHDGTSFSGGAQMLMSAEENYSGTNKGSNITFQTTSLAATSPTAKMRITANGFVGIGTTVPTEILDIQHSDITDMYGGLMVRNTAANANSWSGLTIANNTGNMGYLWSGSSTYTAALGQNRMILESTAAATGLSLRANGAGDVRFLTGSTERMRMDSSGRFSVGTTSTTANIEAQGAPGRIRVSNTTDAQQATLVSDPTNGSYVHLRRDGTNEWFVGADPTISGLTYRVGNTAATPAVTFLTSGNVGIGTTAPSYRLDVIGAAKIGAQAAQVKLGGAFGAGDSGLWMEYGTVPNTARIQAETQGVAHRNLALNPAGGNVGIGTTSPSEKLTVEGNLEVRSGQAYVTSQTSSAASPLTFNANLGNVMVWSTSTASPTVNVHNMKPGGSYMLVVAGTGTGALTVNCFSDAGSTSLPSSFVPTNSVRSTAGPLDKTMYNLISDGTNCLITWVTGF